MVVLLLAVILGGVLGRVGAPLAMDGLRPRVRRLPLLGLGASGHVLAHVVDGDAATVLIALSLAVLLAFVSANTHVTGMVVIGGGLLLNLLAVVLNDGMPVRASALVTADVVEAADLGAIQFAGPRHLETASDPAAVLGDVIPVPMAREVVSFGDLVIVLGAADAVRVLARRRRRAPEEAVGHRPTPDGPLVPSPRMNPARRDAAGSPP